LGKQKKKKIFKNREGVVD